jgi:hypothetical protein
MSSDSLSGLSLLFTFNGVKFAESRISGLMAYFFISYFSYGDCISCFMNREDWFCDVGGESAEVDVENLRPV